MSDAGDFADVELAEPLVRAVEGRDASRFYGRHRALHDCTFEARTGDSWAVVGPNGAGKSTLLNLLATIVRPSEGAIVFKLVAAADGSSVAQRVPVVLGLRGDGFVEVTQGLAVGDVVVTAGQQRLQKDATRVRVADAAARPAERAASR